MYYPTRATLLEGIHREELPSAPGASDSAMALRKMQRLCGLWRTVLALQIAEEKLWEAMRYSWAELSLQARRGAQ